MEHAGGLECLLKVFQSCSVPARLKSSGTIGHCDHLLPMALLVLVSHVMTSLGRGGIVGAVTTIEVADGLGFPSKVGLDGLLADGVLGGNVQELSCHAWGLTTKCVYERLTGRATDEGVDHVGVGDVWELIELLGEALNVVLVGLISPLLVVVEILGVP